MTFWNDLKHSFRLLIGRPGLTIAAVLSLGLGIGACTSIFSVVNGVLLRPLPYPNPDQIVQIREADANGKRPNGCSAI
jgi:putative ABC transport system permease protein